MTWIGMSVGFVFGLMAVPLYRRFVDDGYRWR
jgi:hypothetical protein